MFLANENLIDSEVLSFILNKNNALQSKIDLLNHSLMVQQYQKNEAEIFETLNYLHDGFKFHSNNKKKRFHDILDIITPLETELKENYNVTISVNSDNCKI